MDSGTGYFGYCVIDPCLLEPDYEVAQANSGVTRPVIGKYFPQLRYRRTGISHRTHSRREKSIRSRIVLGGFPAVTALDHTKADGSRFKTKDDSVPGAVKQTGFPHIFPDLSAHLVNVQNTLHKHLRLFPVCCELSREQAQFFCHLGFEISCGPAFEPAQVQKLEIKRSWLVITTPDSWSGPTAIRSYSSSKKWRRSIRRRCSISAIEILPARNW